MNRLKLAYNALFGTIEGNTSLVPVDADFIPLDNKGATLDIKGDTAQWFGLRTTAMQKKAYESCYPLASVVDALADYDLNGIVEILKDFGKKKDDYAKNDWAVRMKSLLARPNYGQSWEQFRGQQIVYKKIFGYCPVLPIVPAGFSPDFATSIINLPPWLFGYEKEINRSIYNNKIENFVKFYTLNMFGNIIKINPKDIFILEDSFVQDELTDFILPQSRLVGLDMAISNTCYAMEADNVLLRKKGPLGFISHDAAATKDSISGYLPMTRKQKDDLQGDLQRYGLTLQQYQYVISKVAIRWNPMSFDVRQLGTKETVVSGEKAICHRFRFPYVLYEETDATYANGSNAASSVYTNNVIPNNRKDFNKYNMFFGAAEARAIIKADFSEVAALQEDELSKAQAASTLDVALEIEYKNRMITKNQWLSSRGYDSVVDGDTYLSDGNSTDPLAVTLGVGGTQSLIDLLANPSLDDEAKKNSLVILFGLLPEDAQKMVSKTTPPIDGNPTPQN